VGEALRHHSRGGEGRVAKGKVVTKADRRLAEIRSIIGSDVARVEEIARAIHKMDSYRRYLAPGRPSDRSKPFTKADKKKAESIASAFRRFETILNRRPDRRYVDRVLLLRLPGFEEFDEFLEWKARLPQWRQHFEEIAEWPLGQPKPSAERFALRRRAAALAAELLDSHGRPVTVTRMKSSFCRLAAVLFGDKRADLYPQCRAIREERNRGRK
jgi:hypothetical protein